MGFWDHIENEEYANSILKHSKTECMSLIEEPGSWFYTLKQIYEIFDMKWSSIKPEKHDQRKLLENMRRSYEEYWKNSIGKQGNGRGQLSTYRQIKIGFRKEKYLDSIKFFSEISALTKLRISAHRLDIETYRYGKKPIPRNERFCSLCIPDRLIHIGDEFHAIMVCNKFQKSRSEIIEMFRQECEQFDEMRIHEKIIYILTYEGPLMSHVAKIVHEIISVKRDVSVWHMYSKM